MSTFQRGHADYLNLGDWNAACSVCGRKYKASEMVQLPGGSGIPWAGPMFVCRKDYRPRQPQDFVRGIPDIQSPPWVQPWQDSFNLYVWNITDDDLTAGSLSLDLDDAGASDVIINLSSGDVSLNIGTLTLTGGDSTVVTINNYAHVTTFSHGGASATITVNNFGGSFPL